MVVDDDAGELVSSLLWDAETLGIVEIDGQMLAGFADHATAASVAERATDWPVTVIAIEPNEWAGTDEVTTVTIERASSGAVSTGPSTELSIVAGPTFGHGGHPTTALAIELIVAATSERLLADATPSMLDVGTGSGVLAIAGATLGADPVIGLDNDPEAIPIARANADRNGVDATFTDATIDQVIEATTGPGFDLVVVNVLLAVHRELASAVVRAIAPGGTLITSGYLEADGPSLVALYRSSIEDAGTGPVRAGIERQQDGWLGHRFEIG